MTKTLRVSATILLALTSMGFHTGSRADSSGSFIIWEIVGRDLMRQHYHRVTSMDASLIDESKDFEKGITYLSKLKQRISKAKAGFINRKISNRNERTFAGQGWKTNSMPASYTNLRVALNDFFTITDNKHNSFTNRYNKLNNSGLNSSSEDINLDTQGFKSAFEIQLFFDLESLIKKTPRLELKSGYAGISRSASDGLNKVDKLLEKYSGVLRLTKTGLGEKLKSTSIRREINNTLSWLIDDEKADTLKAVCHSRDHFLIYPSVCNTKDSYEKLYLEWSEIMANQPVKDIVSLEKLFELRRAAFADIAQQANEASAIERKLALKEKEANHAYIKRLEKETNKKSLFLNTVRASNFIQAIIERRVDDGDKGKFIAIRSSDSSYYVSQVLSEGVMLEAYREHENKPPILIIMDGSAFKGDSIGKLGTVFGYQGLIKYTTTIGSTRQAVLLLRLK